ncbi:carbohydrate ABC transporter permease [Paenibacillus cookii]|uniref:ABC transporter permease n=1 Tax=Paenibacillus cookii TaxID=157839 RepID=A0ABQ4LZC9_9BACL|nr:carbohydrate ABC transporter permease [Paenibacillus cookii]KHF32754.1 L-arabinose transport system permease protein AraQ [Paenibacillus sp. P1XP2]GIO68283.1 ABC transporter permease [Paenibacillus cookii]
MHIQKRRYSFSQVLFHLIAVAFCAFTTIPFILTIMVSVSGESSVIKHGYSLFPDTFSWDAYRLIFSGDEIWRGYMVSVTVMAIGTGAGLLLSAMLAHTMARQKVRYRNGIALFIFITMIFNAGLVPWYIFVTKYLHLKDTLAALILPMLINPFHVFLIRNYFKSLPPALLESAEMEGAGPLYVFAKIMLPLSAPIIATVALFYSLAYWNDWGLALWLIDDRKLYPLQFILFKIQSMINYMSTQGNLVSGSQTLPSETAQMAMVLVTIGPIILVYPFIQRYFVKGIMIGAVKG